MQSWMAKSQDILPFSNEGARWDDVRVFLAARRHPSLGAAARSLGLDTSTMSRRLTSFEEAIGARLFERTRGGLLPTHAAELITEAAEAMEAAHGRLVRDATDVETAVEGTVRFAAAPGMTDVFVAPALVRLREKHPRIRIELDASVRPLDLTRREADIALRSVAPTGADLVVAKLGTGRWIPAASPELAKSLGKLVSWRDAPWIGWDRDLASFAPARFVEQHAGKDNVVLRTSHFASQIAAAESGLAAMLVPEPYVRARALVPLRLGETLRATTETLPVDSLWLVGHRALRTVPRVAAVWDFFADELRRTMGEKRPR